MSDDIIKRLREAIAEHPLSPIHGYAADIAALLDRLDKADEMRDVLLRNGFVECDISACNCGSWHHRYGLPERMREIKEALSEAGHDLSNENGHSILRALNALLTRLDKAERERERLRSESKAQLEELGRIDDALGTNEGPSAVDHIMILKTKNERLREDAERYRWLRGREDGRYMTVYAFRTDIDEVCLGDELDAAIDAARAAEQSDEV